MDCSLSGFSAHGIFQARVLQWGAIAFSEVCIKIILLSFFLWYLIFTNVLLVLWKCFYIFIHTNVMWVIRKMNYYCDVNGILHNIAIWGSLIETSLLLALCIKSHMKLLHTLIIKFFFLISTLRILDPKLKKLPTKYSLYRWSNLRKVN